MLQPKVYSKIDKKVLEVVEIDFDYRVIVVRNIKNSNNNIVGTLNFSNVEFMENTGGKDKNGNYIYTGNIVKDDEDIYIIKRSEIYRIFSIGNEKGYLFLDAGRCSEVEVIGNIYENKELLGNEVE